MKSKKILIIDDEWESRKGCYEALETNLNTRLERDKHRIEFTFLEYWAQLVDVCEPIDITSFDAIISDYFLEGSNDNKSLWPGKTVNDVLRLIPPGKKTPVFVLSGQWNSTTEPILHETLQNPNVASLLLLQNIEAEKNGKSYASALIQKELFPKTKYHLIEQENAVITILHCSDFHYEKCNAAQFQARLDILFDSVSQELQFSKGGRLDFLCMGGDFVDKGSLDNYLELQKTIKNFISRFMKSKCKNSPIVLTVPGNHDYNRDVAKLLPKHSYLSNSIFYPYWDFVRQLSPEMNEIQENPDNMWIYENTAPFGFYFYGLNTELKNIPSCNGEALDDEAFNKLHAKVAENDLSKLRETHLDILEQYGDADPLPIILMHRTISPKEVTIDDPTSIQYVLNHNEIRNAITQRNVAPIFLCGDIHRASEDILLGGKGGLVSSAPAFMGEADKEFGQGFNMIFLIKKDGIIKEVKIIPFTYKKREEKFAKRTDMEKYFERKKGRFSEKL